jgi:nitrate/nitrite transporter NarK
VCLSIAFLMLELTIGPVWAVPLDVAPVYAGTASEMVNAGAAVAGIIPPVAFGVIIDRTGNWTLPFAGSIVLPLAGIVAAFWMKPQHMVDDPAPAEPLPALSVTASR